MIFVDTSVWISFFQGPPERHGAHLVELLDQDCVALAAPVRIEILSGASRRDLPRLRRLLSALPIFYPAQTTWSRIEDWVERASAQGVRFGVGDLLIGAIAADQEGEIWSLDADFARLARFGFLRLHGSPSMC